MPPRYENLEKLKHILSTRPLSIEEISQQLEVNPRTTYRYVQTLLKSFPLKRESSSKGTLYSLPKEEGKSLSLNYEKQLRQAIQEASNSGQTPLANIFEDLLKQVNEQGPPSLKLASFNKHFHLDPGPFAEHKALEHRNLHQKILSAIDEKKEITLVYESKGSKETMQFCPLRYSLRMGRLYLLGFKSIDPKTIISLRDSRIKQQRGTGKTFKIPAGVRAEDFYKHTFGQFSRTSTKEKPLEIVLKTSENWAKQFLKESHFNPPAKIREEGDALFLTVKLINTPDLIHTLSGWLPEIQIESPATLKTEIKTRLKKALKAL